MNRKIVCRTASVTAFVVWPLLIIAATCIAIIAVTYALGWLGKLIGPHPSAGKWTLVVLVSILGTCWFIAHGIKAYEWVQARCSVTNGGANSP